MRFWYQHSEWDEIPDYALSLCPPDPLVGRDWPGWTIYGNCL
jgi:hypothetical protein